MDERRKPCNCVNDCPCYPRCDEMMEGGIPQSWWRTPAAQPQQTYMAQADRAAAMEEEERDWQRLKELYPDMAKILLGEVEATCDRLEYEGSMMFDTVPEKNRVWDMTEQIVERVRDRLPQEMMPNGEAQAEQTVDLFTMQSGPCRSCRPGQNWLGDFVQVLLYQEMYHRRCRHRGCRRW